MSISAGTYTFGTSGTYATLRAALQDIVIGSSLTGDLVFNQVGDSVDVLGVNAAGNIVFDGYRLTIAQPTPAHVGDPTLPFLCSGPSLTIVGITTAGSLTFDNILWMGGAVFLSPAGALNDLNAAGHSVDFVNSLFIYSGTTGTFGLVQGPPGGGSGTGFFLRMAATKFYGGDTPFLFGLASSTLSNIARENVLIENCAFVSRTGGTTPLSFSFLVGSPATHIANFKVRNTVCWVGNVGQPGMRVTDASSGIYDNTYLGANCFFTNARNPATDTFPGWSSTGITTPADILTLNSALPQFAETNPASSLYTAGSAPQITFNPFSAAPYPIGLYYAPAPPPAAPSGLWIPAFIGGI